MSSCLVLLLTKLEKERTFTLFMLCARDFATRQNLAATASSIKIFVVKCVTLWDGREIYEKNATIRISGDFGQTLCGPNFGQLIKHHYVAQDTHSFHSLLSHPPKQLPWRIANSLASLAKSFWMTMTSTLLTTRAIFTGLTSNAR